jgi:hypothetical protein
MRHQTDFGRFLITHIFANSHTSAGRDNVEEMETYIDMDMIGNKLDYIINLDSGFFEVYLHAFLSLNVVHGLPEDIDM